MTALEVFGMLAFGFVSAWGAVSLVYLAWLGLRTFLPVESEEPRIKAFRRSAGE